MTETLAVVHSRFNPSTMPADLLERTFVQREDLANRLVSIFDAGAKGESRHHVLLVGSRGIGKSHLVALVYHRLRSRPELNGKLEIAWLAEDDWGIASYLDLLLNILVSLGVNTKEIRQPNAEALASEILGERIQGKTLLLLVENLDSILRNIGDAGQKKWRALIQNTGYWSIMATATALSEEIHRQASPFYGFFELHHLKGLSDDEGIHMLQALAKAQGKDELYRFIGSPAGRARVRAVQHLAQGNHRVLLIFYDFLEEDSRQDLLALLWKTIDALTPYYQSKMRELSPQQRKLVDFLCRNRIPATVKSIAMECHFTHQIVSSQLKQLLEARFVRVERIGREAYYELAEPLMRICVEAKSHSEAPLPLLVELLRCWFSRSELEERVQLELPEWSKAYFQAAIREYERSRNSHLEKLSVEGFKRLLNAPRQKLGSEFRDAATEVAVLAERAENWLPYGFALYCVGRGKEAITKLEREAARVPGSPYILTVLSFLYGVCNQKAKFSASIEQLKGHSLVDVTILLNLGRLLAIFDRNMEALVTYEIARSLGIDTTEHISRIANLLLKVNRPEDALPLLLAIPDEIGRTSETQLDLAKALSRTGRRIEAISVLEEARISFPYDAKVIASLSIEKLLNGDVIGSADESVKLFQLKEVSEDKEAVDRTIGELFISRVRDAIVDAVKSVRSEDDAALTLILLSNGTVNEYWNPLFRAAIWVCLQSLAGEVESNPIHVLRGLARALDQISRTDPEYIPIHQFASVMARFKESGDPRILLELPLEQRTLLTNPN